MDYIKGKIRKIIYQNESGFQVALFRIKETNDIELKDSLNKTITVTGVILDANMEETYILYGEYINNERFGYQYSFKSYERVKPSDVDSIVEYLSSSLVKGCGEKTALKIAEAFGEDAISIIKDNPERLMEIKGMSKDKAEKIYNSILANESVSDIIIKLKEYGFSMNESTKIYNKYHKEALEIIKSNIYLLKEIIDFKKLDDIFTRFNDKEDITRLKACTLESMEYLAFKNGDVYSCFGEIKKEMAISFNITLADSPLYEILKMLIDENKIILEKENYYLKEYYEMELDIANYLYAITETPLKKVGNIDEEIKKIENSSHIKYNEEQKNAIYQALNNRVTIISGGPGTGKTTIINAIVKIYTSIYNLSPIDVFQSIALIAPTGRASRKMSMSTSLPAMTIHRYLKWNKDTNNFGINEYNKNYHKLIIVDEVSMIDILLFSSLLKGITTNVLLVLVGDSFQLPSVGPGLILSDLINSDMFSYCPLKEIYRQSSDSYIPYLARDIKEKNIDEDILSKKDDYNFLQVPSLKIKNTIAKICDLSLEKGLSVDDIEILAPLYKGENGIDNLNITLQEIFNPQKDKKEIKIGDITYREGDKVLQLQNNPDANVYNGDIGYIEEIKKEFSPRKRDVIIINFEGTKVIYKKEDMFNVKHAYAITIHKSQGSEFPHVIMPITKSYSKMLYNKLIYTGVSRAKKSLVIIGDVNAFTSAVLNDYSTNRKTTLKERIVNRFLN